MGVLSRKGRVRALASARWCGALGAASVTASLGCSIVERPWRDGGAEGSVALLDSSPDASSPDAGSPDAADDAHPADVVDAAGARNARADAAYPGCNPDESARVDAAWQVFRDHVQRGSPEFLRCMRDRVFSPSPSAFAEEIIYRALLERANVRCEDLPAASGREPVVGPSSPAELFALLIDRRSLASSSSARVAAGILRELLVHQRFIHYGSSEGERPWGVPEQAERCLLVATQDPAAVSLPALMGREGMRVESELQPAGAMRMWEASTYYLECPPGSWVTGYGRSIFEAVGSVPRISAFGIRCGTRIGAQTMDLSTGSVGWIGCPNGQVAVGAVGLASTYGIYDARFECIDWADVSRPVHSPTDGFFSVPGGLHAFARRCPAGQVMFALSATVDPSPTWLIQITPHCRDPARPRPGAYRTLPAIGVSKVMTERPRRAVRCADQGVITGFYGAINTSMGYIHRLGAFCRGTDYAAGGALVSRTEAGLATQEHVLAAAGGTPFNLSALTPIERGADGAPRGRCPAGQAVVGLRLRRGGTFGITQHLQMACAPLDGWMSAAPPAPAFHTVAGEWPAELPPTTETAQCPAGSFLTGYQVHQVSVETLGPVIERLIVYCRDFRPAS